MAAEVADLALRECFGARVSLLESNRIVIRGLVCTWSGAEEGSRLSATIKAQLVNMAAFSNRLPKVERSTELQSVPFEVTTSEELRL